MISRGYSPNLEPPFEVAEISKNFFSAIQEADLDSMIKSNDLLRKSHVQNLLPEVREKLEKAREECIRVRKERELGK